MLHFIFCSDDSTRSVSGRGRCASSVNYITLSIGITNRTFSSAPRGETEMTFFKLLQSWTLLFPHQANPLMRATLLRFHWLGLTEKFLTFKIVMWASGLPSLPLDLLQLRAIWSWFVWKKHRVEHACAIKHLPSKLTWGMTETSL